MNNDEENEVTSVGNIQRASKYTRYLQNEFEDFMLIWQIQKNVNWICFVDFYY